MDVGIALVAGIAIGWLIEWVIDWQYWRRGLDGFYKTETELRNQISAQEKQLQEASAALDKAKQELSITRAQLNAAKAPKAVASEVKTPDESQDL